MYLTLSVCLTRPGLCVYPSRECVWHTIHLRVGMLKLSWVCPTRAVAGGVGESVSNAHVTVPNVFVGVSYTPECVCLSLTRVCLAQLLAEKG